MWNLISFSEWKIIPKIIFHWNAKAYYQSFCKFRNGRALCGPEKDLKGLVSFIFFFLIFSDTAWIVRFLIPIGLAYWMDKFPCCIGWYLFTFILLNKLLCLILGDRCWGRSLCGREVCMAVRIIFCCRRVLSFI